MSSIVTIPVEDLFQGVMRLLDRMTKSGLSAETVLVLCMDPTPDRRILFDRVGRELIKARPEILEGQRYPTKLCHQIADWLEQMRSHCIARLSESFGTIVIDWRYGGRVGDTVFFYLPESTEPPSHVLADDTRVGPRSIYKRSRAQTRH